MLFYSNMHLWPVWDKEGPGVSWGLYRKRRGEEKGEVDIGNDSLTGGKHEKGENLTIRLVLET